MCFAATKLRSRVENGWSRSSHPRGVAALTRQTSKVWRDVVRDMNCSGFLYTARAHHALDRDAPRTRCIKRFIVAQVFTRVTTVCRFKAMLISPIADERCLSALVCYSLPLLTLSSNFRFKLFSRDFLNNTRKNASLHL